MPYPPGSSCIGNKSSLQAHLARVQFLTSQSCWLSVSITPSPPRLAAPLGVAIRRLRPSGREASKRGDGSFKLPVQRRPIARRAMVSKSKPESARGRSRSTSCTSPSQARVGRCTNGTIQAGEVGGSLLSAGFHHRFNVTNFSPASAEIPCARNRTGPALASGNQSPFPETATRLPH